MRPSHAGATVLAVVLATTLNGWALPAARPGRRSPAAPAQLRQGRQVFVQLCAACHGENGNGKPASGLTLKPPALDLTGFELSKSVIERVLQQGVMGTGMASWKSLPSEQLSAVAAYTATLARPDALHPADRLAPEAALREAGRRVYAAHCARCHGVDGKGDGPEAGRYKPPPPSFVEMRPSYPAAARVMAAGVPGSAMPAWPLLTRAEVQAVTFYIRSLYAGEAPAAVAAPAKAARGTRP